MAKVHVSIVSHRQSALVGSLLADLVAFAEKSELRFTVLSNVPEARPAVPAGLESRIEYLVNDHPRGFGANHNRVFTGCEAPYFCVLNPDLKIACDPFPPLLAALQDERTALAAPAAYDPFGALQDSARALPTPLDIALKTWSAQRGANYPAQAGIAHPDWVAGLFMLFRTEAYRAMGGFDERYFLYYEDVDLCSRLRLAGWRIVWLPKVSVVHDARRQSHRDPRHFLWHLRSVTRFFCSSVYRRARALAR